MAYPEGVTLAHVTIPADLDTGGNVAFPGRRGQVVIIGRVRHLASGQRITGQPQRVVLGPDGTGAFDVPHSDQLGFDRRGWTYRLAWDDGTVVTFAVPTASGPEVRLTELVRSAPHPGVVVPPQPGPAGATGPQGPQGTRGEPGPAGATGPQGPTGPQGSTGPRGPQGDLGDTGPQGVQGSSGPRGATGATGPQGAAGPVGPAGLNWRGVWSELEGYAADDATYYAGAAWFASRATTGAPPDSSPDWQPLAARGATGPTGPVGPVGPLGLTGPLGLQGVQGERGPEGLTGPTGPTGPQGPIGATGPQGVKGDTGSTGATGAKGDPGDLSPVASGSPTGNYQVSVAMLPSTRTFTLIGNVTIVLPASPPSALISGTITLVFVQAATGGPYTVTWPASGIRWAEGAPAPAMPTGASNRLVVHLFWTGFEWLGAVMGRFY